MNTPEHTPLTEAEWAELEHLVMSQVVERRDERIVALVVRIKADAYAAGLAARTSTATADTGLRERVEAELDLAEQSERHVADDEVLVEVAVIRAALDATAAPTTDTGARYPRDTDSPALDWIDGARDE